MRHAKRRVSVAWIAVAFTDVRCRRRRTVYPCKCHLPTMARLPPPARVPVTTEYFSQYGDFFALDRTSSGVLTLRLQTNGGRVTFTGPMHSALPRLLDDIAMDRENRVLVITVTGDRFMTEIDGPALATSRARKCRTRSSPMDAG